MSFAQIIKDLEARGQGKLEKKLPSWAGAGVTVPASINLEQCSSEAAALYKAGLVPEGARVADLTGGLGADSWAFSRRASAVWYNERDAVLLEAVQRNFAALGVANVVFNGYDVCLADAAWRDALAAFCPDVVYLDPARRDSAGRKVFLLEDCSPDVVGLMPGLLELAPMVMVKVSPMADLTMLQRRLYGCLFELHIVGLSGECKEVLCICRRDAEYQGVVLFEDGFSSGLPYKSEIQFQPLKIWFNGAETKSPQDGRPEGDEMTESSWFNGSETESTQNDRPEGNERTKTESSLDGRPEGVDMLFVPSAALVKSGLGPGMCLMGFDEGLAHFGRFWQVVENLPFASSAIKELGRRYPQAEVTARGVPVSSEELVKKMRTKPGGSVHIFACVLDGERRLLVCK